MSFRVRSGGKEILVPGGTSLLEALRILGTPVDTLCGGQGLCGKCLVQIVEGDAPRSQRDLAILTEEALQRGQRLACRLAVWSDITVKPLFSQAFEALHENPRSDPPLPLDECGIAVDLGTSTVSAALVNLKTGHRLLTISEPNPTIRLGADVLTRMGAALESEETKESIQNELIQTLAGIESRFSREPRSDSSGVQVMGVAGNTVMTHLLLGLGLPALAASPFHPDPALKSLESSVLLDDSLPPVWVVPIISGFVGGDTTAAILSSFPPHTKETLLLIDIGTNTEVALLNRRKLFVTSAPAGPAFEGAQLSQGMLAAPGAIVRVWPQASGLGYEVLGGQVPRGIAGSGALDALASLVQLGYVDSTGRIADDFCGKVQIAGSVRLTQDDIRALQLAKSAVRSAVEILLLEAEISAREIDKIFLAGSFGTFLSPKSALLIGLLPPVSPDRVFQVGNASLAGTAMFISDEDARQIARSVSEKAFHVSLPDHKAFPEVFISSLDLSRPATLKM